MNLQQFHSTVAARQRRLLFIVVGALAAWPAPAQTGRIELRQIASEALSGNLFGDSTNRAFRVYLPPSYDATSKRCPVVYVLHGCTQNESTLVTSGQFMAMDSANSNPSIL